VLIRYGTELGSNDFDQGTIDGQAGFHINHAADQRAPFPHGLSF
jgi:hypothetical protein